MEPPLSIRVRPVLDAVVSDTHGAGSVITEAGAALVLHDRIGEPGRAMVPHALRIPVPDLCGAGSRLRTGRRPSARCN